VLPALYLMEKSVSGPYLLKQFGDFRSQPESSFTSGKVSQDLRIDLQVDSVLNSKSRTDTVKNWQHQNPNVHLDFMMNTLPNCLEISKQFGLLFRFYQFPGNSPEIDAHICFMLNSFFGFWSFDLKTRKVHFSCFQVSIDFGQSLSFIWNSSSDRNKIYDVITLAIMRKTIN